MSCTKIQKGQYIYKKQDIYLLTSYIPVSSKLSKTIYVYRKVTWKVINRKVI